MCIQLLNRMVCSVERCFSLGHDMAMVEETDFNLHARKTPLPSGYFPIPIAEDAEKTNAALSSIGLSESHVWFKTIVVKNVWAEQEGL